MWEHIGSTRYSDYDGDSQITLYACPKCGAVCTGSSKQRHEKWHGDVNGAIHPQPLPWETRA